MMKKLEPPGFKKAAKELLARLPGHSDQIQLGLVIEALGAWYQIGKMDGMIERAEKLIVKDKERDPR